MGFVGAYLTDELPVPAPDPHGEEQPDRYTESIYEEIPQDPNHPRWRLWFINKLTEHKVFDVSDTPVRKTTWEYTDDGRTLRGKVYADPTGQNPGAEVIVTEHVYDPATINIERTYTYKQGQATPAYGSRLQYLDNVFVVKHRTLDPNNPTAPLSQAFAYPSKDLVREPTSGVVIATRVPAGIRTDLYVDTLGRLTSVAPASPEEPITVSYPSILETIVTQGDDASNDFVRTKYRYDTLGRLIETRRRTETGCWALQTKSYDIAGRETFVSEWGFDPSPVCSEEQLAESQLYSPSKGTRLWYCSDDPACTGIDPLGRLLKVTTADGKSTTASYTGAGTAVTIGDVDGQASTTYYERDGLGNLVLVDAPVGADARYAYSALDELVTVDLISQPPTGPQVIQQRSFVHDRLGRLRTSTNPENGTVQFTRYDPAGRVLEKIESDGTKFTFAYDAGGRVTSVDAAEDVTDPNAAAGAPRVYGPTRAMARYFYDETGVPNGAGRLTRVDSYDETGALISRRKTSYGGLNAGLLT